MKLTVGIDASNIRGGGGVTHLVELLREIKLPAAGINCIVIWGCNSTLNKIEDADWLEKVYEPLLERNLLFRTFWKHYRLKLCAQQYGCDVLFVPGGTDTSGFRPVVTMSQNLLPFMSREIFRYGFSLYVLKFFILRWAQSRSFRVSDGVIFLTQYARDTVKKVAGSLRGSSVIIPHGVNRRFLLSPRPQRLYEEFSYTSPCRVLYVSIISPYKHQWQVVKAISLLRSSGVPVVLDLIGPSGGGMKRLQKAMNSEDPKGDFVRYHGEIPYESLNDYYTSADIGVFASSCENMPNILLENMAAALPIACSNKGPMPEILGKSGVYFNPEDSTDIANAIQRLMKSHQLRERLANEVFGRAQKYTWNKSAEDTIKFLASFVKNTNKDSDKDV